MRYNEGRSGQNYKLQINKSNKNIEKSGLKTTEKKHTTKQKFEQLIGL
jgi:hypothetical protein